MNKEELTKIIGDYTPLEKALMQLFYDNGLELVTYFGGEFDCDLLKTKDVRVGKDEDVYIQDDLLWAVRDYITEHEAKIKREVLLTAKLIVKEHFEGLIAVPNPGLTLDIILEKLERSQQ